MCNDVRGEFFSSDVRKAKYKGDIYEEKMEDSIFGDMYFG